MYRKASWNDLEDVYALICELEQKQLPFEPFSSIYREQLDDRRFYCLVYEHEGHLAGVLNLRLEPQLHHSGRIAEILELAVEASCRGQGIGKELLAQACRIAKEAGCTQIEVASGRQRTGAHRFYLREGMHSSHLRFSMPLA